jgi:cyclophilin family peptidyl-prolyl cis-trans isomerase
VPAWIEGVRRGRSTRRRPSDYLRGVRTTLAALILLSACSSSSSSGDVDAQPSGPPDAPVDDHYLPAGYTLTPFLSSEAQHSFPAAETVIEDGKDYLAVLETTEGRIVLDLLEGDTPITVNSFVWLTLHHYFDGIAFHRVIDGFVAQGGDPNTLGTDTSTWGIGGPGYSFGLEIVDGLSYDAAGVVGMARSSDPNSNGSQFFITLAPATSLDGDYTIFARVSEGIDVLPLIERGEPPQDPTRMTRVHIVEKAN